MKNILSIYLTLFISLGAYAQKRMVKGVILDREMVPLWYCGIYIKDWVKAGETDSLGKYEIVIPDGVDSIIFNSIGYEPLLIKLAPGCSHVEVIMIPSSTYDFMTPEKVDRERRRLFNKIDKLYPVAVQKGLFMSDPPCHNLIFQRNAPEMRQRHKEWLHKKDSAQHALLKSRAEVLFFNDKTIIY